jgi:hypothetical protein
VCSKIDVIVPTAGTKVTAKLIHVAQDRSTVFDTEHLGDGLDVVNFGSTNVAAGFDDEQPFGQRDLLRKQRG